MTSNEGKYNIKAISTMLGIQAGTLRAWERRYHIIEPIRNSAGHRLYSDEHVAILRWLIDKVNKGFTIGQAVGLFEKGNITLQTDYSYNEQHEDYSVQLSQEILEALLSFKENQAHQLLNQAFSLFSIDKVTIDILGTLLVKVGHMWENNEISVAHEHFVTSFLRTKIGNIFHGMPIDGFLPKVVAICGPNETHELGLMIFTLFLRRKGFEVIYLGAGIPIEDIELVLREVDAKMFFTSCTMESNVDATVEVINHLKTTFPSLIIGAGGYALDEMLNGRTASFNQYLVGQTKQDWELWLQDQLKSQN
ncbi:MerR family transcriptional regulator [Halalkalibacter nanhaiisediminis]|uniref:Methanogenic corrinoid protein MtbC1 n=1 Tax=Halalkalibacter nanhaiisediminis TaxID=688079 RepID=A0A562QCZ7_9BACI|nr:MerR family transcriptional regulator [Halalkalibacter nanhaiisediminis]TWI54604.1 methanogenic corrinoid protein MtbC1 [Halalkalibacter nanhaiisediminis]